MAPGANLLAVTDASCILFVLIALSAILLLLMAPFATTGAGYEPARSPAAPPDGGRLEGIRPACNFVAVIEPSAILVEVTAPSLIWGEGKFPCRSPLADPTGGAAPA